MGTGMRYFDPSRLGDSPFRGHVLLSHLHWDHTQGLPFFTPILCPGSRVDIYGPAQEDGRTVGDVLTEVVRPPVFPIGLTTFPGLLDFHDVSDTDFSLSDEVSVMARLIPHVGPTCGYRLTWKGRSIAYLSDHQMPYDGSMSASDNALELAAGADMLIHDSQYTPTEFVHKSTWGHCTVEYAIWLAAEAGVETLVLFHHDPSRYDDAIDEIAVSARRSGERKGVQVVAAAEGMTINV